LQPPTVDEATAIFTEYAHDPEVTRYLEWSPPQTIETTRDDVRHRIRAWEQETAFSWIITRKTDGLPLGMAELRMRGHQADLGYVIARAHWGQGIATEAVRALTDWALAQPAIRQVWAVCAAENIASARVLEKIGMQREVFLRHWLLYPQRTPGPRTWWCYMKGKPTPHRCRWINVLRAARYARRLGYRSTSS
jgi:RimJ/RimL family protein N-acetyltransferase